MSRCVHRVRRCGGRDQSARIEVLEHRRLLAGEIPRLVGISGNQQNPAYLDETLYDIYYDMPGTRDPRFLDGFADIATNPPDTVLSVSAPLGVTRGYGALRVDVPQRTGAYWGFSSPNVVELLKAGATSLTYEMTLINRELNGGSFGEGTDNSFNGFAQNNKLAVVINTPNGGFIERDFSAVTDADSLSTSATWSGVDGTRNILWDLSTFRSGGMSLADFITANNATDARFWFVTQGGDSNGETGPMRFYFDNFVLHSPTTSTLFGDFELVDIEPIVTLPFVPDTDAIGFNPETGLLHRTSGASAYRNDPTRVGYNDNHAMQTIDLFSPALTQAGVFNANPQGDGANGPYGVPAPRPNWLMPAQRRTDEQIDMSFRQQGPNEYHAARDLTWSHSEHLFYVADQDGIFKLTADGQSTFVGQPAGIHQEVAKGITFFTIEGQRRLLISERDGSLLWTIDPATGQTTANVVPLMDADFASIPGVLSLVEHPDGKMLMGIGKSLQEPDNAFMRDLILINPVTGLTTRLGSFGVHMADLAFVYLPGDTDFDADVDADDYFDIDRGDAMDLAGYENGDFNYSGQAGDADDYMLIDRAFLRQQAGAPLGGPLGAAPAAAAVSPPPFLVAPAGGDEDEGGLFGDAAVLLS